MIKEFAFMLLISLILFFLPKSIAETIAPKVVLPTPQPTATASPTQAFSEKPVLPGGSKTDSGNFKERAFKGMVRSKNVSEIVLDFPCTIKTITAEEGRIYFENTSLMTIDTTLYDEQISAKEKLLVQKEETVKKLKTDKKSITEEEGLIRKIKYELNEMKAKRNKPYIQGNSIVCNQPKGVVRDLKGAQGLAIESTFKVMTIHNISNIYIEVDADKDTLDTINKGMKVTVADKSVNKGYEGYVANKSNIKFFILLNRENEILIPASEVEVLFR